MTNYSRRPSGYGYAYIANGYTVGGYTYALVEPKKSPLGYESKSGVSVPFWKQKIEKRLNASSAYTRYFCEIISPGILDVHVKGPNGGIVLDSRALGFYSTGLASLSDPYGDSVTSDIALSKIKAKIQSDKGDYAAYTDLVQDVAEFRKTIYGTLDGISNLIKDVQRVISNGVGSNRRSLIPQLAGLYLAWVFGINPTIQDAKSLAAGIESYLNRKDFMKRYQAGHYRDSNNSRVSTINPSYGISCKVVESIRRRYYVSYTSGHISNLRSSNDYGVFQHFHLAPQDFIPALWEWLPWSWLIDYVLTVGPYLEDTFQSEVDTSIYNVKGVKIIEDYRSHIDVTVAPGYSLIYQNVQDRIVRSGSFVRTPMTNLPGRMLRFHTEYELNKNLGNKLANIIAVMLTRQSRR